MERAAHTLKGASANVGATGLAAVCGEMERRGRSAQIGDTAGLIERFDIEFARVQQALAQLLVRN